MIAAESCFCFCTAVISRARCAISQLELCSGTAQDGMWIEIIGLLRVGSEDYYRRGGKGKSRPKEEGRGISQRVKDFPGPGVDHFSSD